MANKQRPLVSLPCVLVLHEKHETLYFHVPDDEALLRAAAKIVADRNEDGWYHGAEGHEPAELDKALGGDARAAWGLLRLRKDYEYEGFDLVPYETVL